MQPNVKHTFQALTGNDPVIKRLEYNLYLKFSTNWKRAGSQNRHDRVLFYLLQLLYSAVQLSYDQRCTIIITINVTVTEIYSFVSGVHMNHAVVFIIISHEKRMHIFIQLNLLLFICNQRISQSNSISAFKSKSVHI